MNKFIAFLCFVSLAVVGSGQYLSSPYSGLANKIEQILNSRRQSFADGFEGLPSLDPISIPGPMSLEADPFHADISDITVTGLSSYNNTLLEVLSNGVFLFAVSLPQVNVKGTINIPVDPKAPYKGHIEASLPDVAIVINGFVSVKNDQIELSEIHTDVTISNSPTVKVIGLPGSNPILNNFASQYLTNNLNNMINSNSDIYEASLNVVVTQYLTSALGSSFTKLVNRINSLA